MTLPVNFICVGASGRVPFELEHATRCTRYHSVMIAVFKTHVASRQHQLSRRVLTATHTSSSVKHDHTLDHNLGARPDVDEPPPTSFYSIYQPWRAVSKSKSSLRPSATLLRPVPCLPFDQYLVGWLVFNHRI